MSLKDKVMKIIAEESMESNIKEFSQKIQDDIFQGIAKRMMQEQKEQNERFLKALEKWDKMTEETIKQKVDKYILSKV